MQNSKSISSYNLSFIKDEDLFNHVSNTVKQYRFNIDIKSFNKNIIDPIKLTFDAKIYKKDIRSIIESEIIRQLDKSNNNLIGYFQQNIFEFIYNKDSKSCDWYIPNTGFDLINKKEKIYVEMKNKHNTMNSSSSQRTFMRMQQEIIKDSSNRCFLVEVIAKNSQDIKWQVSLDRRKVSHNNIRRISVNKFYDMVSGEKNTFRRLLEVLPRVIEDVVRNEKERNFDNKVIEELEKLDRNLLKSLYLLAFGKYEGFDELNINI